MMGRKKKIDAKKVSSGNGDKLLESSKKSGFKNVQDMLTYHWLWYSRKDLQSLCKELIRKANGASIKELSKKVYKIALDGTIDTKDMKTLFLATDWVTITNKIKDQMAMGD